MTLISAFGENRNLKAAQPPNPINLVVSVILDLIFQETAASDSAGFPVSKALMMGPSWRKGVTLAFARGGPAIAWSSRYLKIKR